MNRIRLALLALLLAAPAAALTAPPRMERASDTPKRAVISLKIDGDTIVVVKSLPCTVTAPAGADFYSWSLPAGVTGTGEDNVLTVTAAPQGPSTISVTSITFLISVDKDLKVTKKKVTDTGSVVLTNGMKPPPPPVPPDPMTAAFQTAYDADQDSDRAKSLAFLAGAYKGMAAQAASRTDLKTNADFVAWMKSVVAAPGVGLTPSQLKSLRTAIGAELAKAWGANNLILSPADAASELAKIATALSGVK